MEKLSKEKKARGLSVLHSVSDSKLETHLNSCVKCGLCSSSCMFYLTFKEKKYIPGYKVAIIRSIYRHYNTFLGKHFPKISGTSNLDRKQCEEMVDLFFGACTMCGRCVKHCSIGVDIPFVVRKGREMLAEMDMIPQTLQSTVNAALTTGNNMAIPTEEFVETIEWMEEELQDEMEDPNARIFLDQENKNIFYTLNPREPKFFPLSISAMAKIFYTANESWTISSTIYDVTNYGFFNGKNDEAATIVRNLYNEVLRLSSKRLILGECGHGSRATRWEGPNLIKQVYETDTITAVELIAEYIRNGKIKLDKTKNNVLATIHDPCNLVRNGGLLSEIRFVVKNAVSKLIEMNPYGIENFCCGGGGGMLAMSEYNDRRLKIGEIKAKQIKATGAKIVITPCHNCVDQLMQLNHQYKLNVTIKTIAEIVADALVIEPENEKKSDK